jgi:glucose/arabinose dehydrogenase
MWRYAVQKAVWMALLGLAGASASPCLAASGNNIDEKLRTPPGYQVSYFATGIEGARMLRFTASGALIVSVPDKGRVILLSSKGQGAAPDSHVLLDGLNAPHGVDVHDGILYIAEEDGVGRIAFNDETGKVEGGYRRIIALPYGGGHSTRTVRVGPDDKLYVTVGSSCNVCMEADPRRAAMLRYDLDGSNGEIYAQGLRNSVGFDWRPADGALFATDNGRDSLGDDFPPCELNMIVQGGHYGWPFANGHNIADPDFGLGAQHKINISESPVYEFRAHNAPLGITFIRNRAAPAELRGAALAALHGSWNRSAKDGYKVVSLHWRADGRIEARDYLWGFLENGEVFGRPVDVAEGPDGAIYVSDDYAGNIYRIAQIAH